MLMNEIKVGMDKIKSLGYKVEKTSMGYDFNNKDIRFSIIKVGDYLQCFHNLFVNDSWKLQSCSQHMLDLRLCIQWILVKMNE